MPRTPLANRLQSAMSVAREAAERGLPAGPIIAEHAGDRLTRRDFLKGAAAAAGAFALRRATPVLAASSPRIAVVGAGLAGLTCAYRLKQAGHLATVYEAANRVGGRCWTLRGYFAGGQIAERGGELIDTGHMDIRHLAQELGLSLDNLLQAEANGTEPLYYFDGEPYTFAQATEDIKDIWQAIHRDTSAASFPTTYDNFTPRGYELDHMSILDWIDENVPGGRDSKLGQLLDVAYNIEYGLEPGLQSSLNMLYLLGYAGQGQLRIFGHSNEKYHVRGGNDQISERMANALSGQIKLGNELVAIRQNSNGTYALTLKNGRRSSDVTADQVVLALPFSILRNSVDFSQAGFKPLKVTAIQELTMGTNSKLHVQFTDRHWEGLACTGDTFADTGYQASWDVTRAQSGPAGILVDYTGGDIGNSFGTGTPAQRAAQFLGQIEPVLPGLSAKWNGKATVDYWAGYKWTLGSYACMKVGQYTGFLGVEREREGNCHFAGEHTSIDFPGYLNGAVETGARAASEILGDLK